MQSRNLKEILKKYKAGVCTPEELIWLENWYLQWKVEHEHFTDEELADIKTTVWLDMAIGKMPVRRISGWQRIAAAAIILISLSAGLYFYLNPNHNGQNNSQLSLLKSRDIAPGSNKAILTLADGKTINLSGANNGKLAQETGITIIKTKDGQLIYSTNVRPGHTDRSPLPLLNYNTIKTPRGGTYEISLTDGTRIWLNAASALKFPATFANTTERKVELTGEAYFEVAKNAAMPFLVITGRQQIKVLGTHFNVNAYGDEITTKTTLLEGSVKVSSSAHSDGVILTPGQQSVLKGAAIQVNTINTESEIAWKNGNFVFNDEGLQSILRKVARWYNVDVVYEGKPAEVSLLGAVSRSKNISAVLNALEQTGKVHFKVEGRRIIVMK